MNQKDINISKELWWGPAAAASPPQIHHLIKSGRSVKNPLRHFQTSTCKRLVILISPFSADTSTSMSTLFATYPSTLLMLQLNISPLMSGEISCGEELKFRPEYAAFDALARKYFRLYCDFSILLLLFIFAFMFQSLSKNLRHFALRWYQVKGKVHPKIHFHPFATYHYACVGSGDVF